MALNDLERLETVTEHFDWYRFLIKAFRKKALEAEIRTLNFQICVVFSDSATYAITINIFK